MPLSTRIAICGFCLLLAQTAAKASPCTGKETFLHVDARRHRLTLCQDGRPIKNLPVSLGQGGVGKKARGDGKTPLGEYALGVPRPSSRFHVFIPVGYPTAAQRRAGFTGSDIGIHGPPKWMGKLGALSQVSDWTDGCIAVASHSAIEEIARWVRSTKCRRLTVQ